MSYLEERRKYIEAGRPLKTKEKKPIAKKSEKRIKKEAEEKERLGGDDTELVKFYKAAMKRMTGHCLWCSAKTETKIYRYAIYSICHILDKRPTVCPSVATHICNWVELCPDHHNMFDSMSWSEREHLGFWPEIHSRLIHVWECLAPEERRHFPSKLRDYIEKNSFPQ